MAFSQARRPTDGAALDVSENEYALWKTTHFCENTGLRALEFRRIQSRSRIRVTLSIGAPNWTNLTRLPRKAR